MHMDRNHRGHFNSASNSYLAECFLFDHTANKASIYFLVLCVCVCIYMYMYIYEKATAYRKRLLFLSIFFSRLYVILLTTEYCLVL